MTTDKPDSRQIFKIILRSPFFRERVTIFPPDYFGEIVCDFCAGQPNSRVPWAFPKYLNTKFLKSGVLVERKWHYRKNSNWVPPRIVYPPSFFSSLQKTKRLIYTDFPFELCTPQTFLVEFLGKKGGTQFEFLR